MKTHALATLALTLSACMINGKPLLGGASNTPATSPGGAATASPARGNSDAERTRDLYQRFTFKNVTAPDATTIFSQVGISSSFNPARKMDNPDPTWIPGWASLSLTDESQTAVLQAAVNRTWQAQMHADYAAYRTAWSAIEAELRPQLQQAIALPEYHARGVALAKLYKAMTERVAAGGLGVTPALRHVGFAHEVLRAIIDLHRDANAGFRLDAYLTALSLTRAELQTTTRPYAEDAVERDLYTALRVDDLPTLNSYGNAFAAVKWPVDKKAAEKTRAGLVAAATAPLASIPSLATIPSLFDGAIGEGPEAKLRWIGGGGEVAPVRVASVTKDGDGARLELATSRDRHIPYGCKDTNQLSNTEPGTFVKDCKYRTETTKLTIQLAVRALPDGVELAKGDEVQLYGDLVSTKHARLHDTFVVDARAFASIKRGDRVVATFW